MYQKSQKYGLAAGFLTTKMPPMKTTIMQTVRTTKTPPRKTAMMQPATKVSTAETAMMQTVQ